MIKSLLYPIMLWLVLGMACNYPTGTGQNLAGTRESARQTLQAQFTLMAQGMPPIVTSIPTPNDIPLGQQTPPPIDFSLPIEIQGDSILYTTRPGDTLTAVAKRFGIGPDEIKSAEPVSGDGYLPWGIDLYIPNRLVGVTFRAALLPDSEVIYSPSSVDFQVELYIQQAAGFLSTYGETVNDEWIPAAAIVERVAADHSINPRLLLAFLEYRSGWVSGGDPDPIEISYPLGFKVPGYQGLYYELGFAATQLNTGYYGWRSGTLTELQFKEGGAERINPLLNPGSVAVQRLFARLYSQRAWQDSLYGADNFTNLYQHMFADPWSRAVGIEPLLPDGLVQPSLELPFATGERWSFTGGPHNAWNAGTPRGGLDFAPVTGEPACVVSRAWVTSSSPGVVVRSSHNVVVVDLDGDGYEQTGWVVLYLHIAEEGRVEAGVQLELDDRIGHPSCERGKSTGTHVHLARKYNGEWIDADGPIPFVLSGWQVQMGVKNYEGNLVKDGRYVVASPVGPQTSIIVR